MLLLTNYYIVSILLFIYICELIIILLISNNITKNKYFQHQLYVNNMANVNLQTVKN